jgi:hypothetical protein
MGMIVVIITHIRAITIDMTVTDTARPGVIFITVVISITIITTTMAARIFETTTITLIGAITAQALAFTIHANLPSRGGLPPLTAP